MGAKRSASIGIAVMLLMLLRIYSERSSIHSLGSYFSNYAISVNSTSNTNSINNNYPPLNQRAANYSTTPRYELCDSCRMNPEAKGKIVTCMNRAEYLMARYKLSEKEAREAVMKQNAENCRRTRFRVELWSPELDTDEEGSVKLEDSVFSQPLSDGKIATSASNNSTSPPPLSSMQLQQEEGNDNLLSIYFYETIPKDMGVDVEHNMAARYASKNNTEENFKSDLAIIHLFRTYKGRTYDPQTADIFVVPFPHASHCLAYSGKVGKWINNCGHVPPDIIQKGILNNLPYYKGNEKRHLFINAFEIFHAHKLLQNVPLSLSLGPRMSNQGGYQIVIPYFSDRYLFQPSQIKQRTEAWWTRPRKYSLTYFFGALNRNMKGVNPRIYRIYFQEEVQTNWNKTSTLGGLPYVLETLNNINATQRFFSEMYSESIFCLVLPGDSTSQKRFFDVIMMGCIPVVLSFDTDIVPSSVSNKSWHLPNGHPIEEAYPWAKGSNSTFAEKEIDYQSFVVEVEGGDVGKVKSTIEALMRDPVEIRRRQRLVMKYAPSFSYGVGMESHVYDDDAFSRIIGSLQFYLSTL